MNSTIFHVVDAVRKIAHIAKTLKTKYTQQKTSILKMRSISALTKISFANTTKKSTLTNSMTLIQDRIDTSKINN